MDDNMIRRIAIATASAAALAVGLGFATPASAVVEGTVAAESEDGTFAQHGVVTAPVVTDGKDGDVATAFKVTDENRTVPWVATADTVVMKRGVKIPASAIAQGDHVTAIGATAKGGAASAKRVVVTG
ncbi:MAG: hypothetical protein HOV94_17120 [Saccharothrix sp.]|nr:hypothetical protein [Saccharothrix sp.]